MRRLFIVTDKEHQNIPKYTGMLPTAARFFETTRRQILRQFGDTL